MKKEPNEVDREAARLFSPKNGVRVLCRFSRDEPLWFRVAGWVGAEDERPIANIVDGNGDIVATMIHTRAVRLIGEVRRWNPRRRAVVKGQPSVESGGMLPDVFALDTDDGPTKGAMLDQIRADRDDPHVSVQRIDGQWCVCAGPVGQFAEFLGTGPTEGAALVDAKKAKGEAQ